MRRSAVVAVALAGLLLPPAGLSGALSPAAFAAPATPRMTDSGPDGPGTWSVEATGRHTWRVSWRAPHRLPVTSDRPTIVSTGGGGTAPGTPMGVPTVAADGRTVRVSVTSSAAPDPAGLDVVLSGDVLDEPTGTTPPGAAPGRVSVTPRWFPPERDLLPVDPGVAGDLPVVSSDYELAPVELRGMPDPVEMVGHVVEPAPEAADPSHPLVLFLHGRHPYCYNPDTDRMGEPWPCAGAQVPIPSQLGYDYIQRLLAGQGYVTVSIAANGINAQDGWLADGGAEARAALVEKHLDQWAAWAGDGEHQVDLDHVVLVGHSRGGEGVSRASLEIPLAAPYRVVGQVLLAPTNFARETTPYVPTVTVLPSCDGDVSDLQGQAYTDLGKGIATGDTSMKSSVMVIGADHNFFNTEWTPKLAAAPAFDDWAGSSKGACSPKDDRRLTAAEQRRVGKAYVAGAVHLFATGDQGYRPMFDGSAVRVGSTRDAVVLSHMVGGGRDLRTPGEGAVLTAPTEADTSLCEGTTPWNGRTHRKLCGRFSDSVEQTPHWPASSSLAPLHRAFEMSWESAGAVGGLELASPMDLTETDWLDLRTVVDPTLGDVAVQVRLTDATGATTDLEPVDGGRLPALPAPDRWSAGRFWAQDLRVDTGDLNGIDASQVVRVELVSQSARGRVWVLDLAGVHAPLPVVPDERAPLVDLGKVRVREGGEGTHVVEVPYTVTGAVTRPATLWVYGFSDRSDTKPVSRLVELPVGSGDGTLSWEYTGDELHGFRRTAVQLAGHAVRDVMMRDNEGRIVIVDDDDAPTLTFRAVRPRAEEGRRAVLEATLSAPSAVATGVGFHVVRGDFADEPLHASDTTAHWLKQWTDWRPGTDPPLNQLEVGVFGWFEPGRTRLRFEVPIRDDLRAEPRETLTLMATTETGWHSDPVTVVVPASD